MFDIVHKVIKALFWIYLFLFFVTIYIAIRHGIVDLSFAQIIGMFSLAIIFYALKILFECVRGLTRWMVSEHVNEESKQP